MTQPSPCLIGLYQGPDALGWIAAQASPRSVERDATIAGAVGRMLQAVQSRGDQALRELAEQFGEQPPAQFQLPEAQIEQAVQRLSPEIKTVLDHAAQNIRAFNQAVLQSLQPVQLPSTDCTVGLDWRPVERVACYVPGGRYPLPSTALMTALTAQAAGVGQIAIFSPQLPDAVIYAGMLAGVEAFYQVGGAQAVAAAAFGTESIPAVDMIVGPGNAYVAEAKRQLSGIIGIDMLAGPSEVVIIADNGANPDWLAADLLAQAEHDPEASVCLLTPDAALVQAVQSAVTAQYEALGLPDYLHRSLGRGALCVLESLQACVEAANRLAPEHLELQVSDPESLKPQLTHYGALFMGYWATVPYGDYLTGPNHTLPTSRTARFSGALTPLAFLRPQTWCHIPSQPERLARDTQTFATLEGLTAHAHAAAIRLSLS